MYLGDIHCSACTSEAFKADLQEVLEHLRSEVESRGATFYTIGALISGDHEAGLEYLTELGPWTEISMGGTWSNSFARKHVWDVAGVGLTPSVFVYARDVVRSGPSYLFENRSRVVRMKGSDMIGLIRDHEEWGRLLPPTFGDDER